MPDSLLAFELTFNFQSILTHGQIYRFVMPVLSLSLSNMCLSSQQLLFLKGRVGDPGKHFLAGHILKICRQMSHLLSFSLKPRLKVHIEVKLHYTRW